MDVVRVVGRWRAVGGAEMPGAFDGQTLLDHDSDVT